MLDKALMSVAKKPSNDQQIIQQLLQGGIDKRKGEELLFSNYAYFIRKGMQKYNLTEEESFDAYSDAVLSSIEQITNGTFERLSSLKTYLFRIFNNKCVDLIRKKTTNKNRIHKTLSITDMFHNISDAARSVVQKLIDKSDRDLLKQKLNELGEACRRMLLLSAEGFTDREISVMMEYKTADVVKTSRLRCLEKLRSLYKHA